MLISSVKFNTSLLIKTLMLHWLNAINKKGQLETRNESRFTPLQRNDKINTELTTDQKK